MSIYSDIGLATTTGTSASTTATSNKTGSYDLTQADFLSLLTTELSYQDPTNPTDNSEMVSQLSQISTVNGITQLNTTASSLSSVVTSSQALMASGLVGQKVLINSNIGYNNGSGMSGVVATGDSGASNLTLSISDASGAVVYTAYSKGDFSGNVPFEWDGKDNAGNICNSGYYTVTANGIVNGTSTTITSQIYGNVQSVITGSGASGTTLNLEGLGKYGIDEVLEIAGNN